MGLWALGYSSFCSYFLFSEIIYSWFPTFGLISLLIATVWIELASNWSDLPDGSSQVVVRGVQKIQNSFALSPPLKPPRQWTTNRNISTAGPTTKAARCVGTDWWLTLGVVVGEPHIAQKPVASTLSHSVGIRIRVSNHFLFYFEIGLVANTYSNKHTHGEGECGDLRFHVKCPRSETTRL